MRYIHIHCLDGTVISIPNDTRISNYIAAGIIRWDSASGRYVSSHEMWKLTALAEAFIVRRAA